MAHADASSPNSIDIGIHPPHYRLPATTHVGRVRLGISNLERSISFYSGTIGLQVLRREGSLAQLGPIGSSTVLLELEELPGVEPITKRSRLGLYHTAFLLPTREDLSCFVRHLAATSVNFGAGDHIYSEALYLTDPDGLSVEVYADRPRSMWIYEGREIVSATNPVRFKDLPQVAEKEWQGLPTGSTVGHVHLCVGNLEKAAGFYHTGLGLDIVTWRYPGALFTSAGGYHHQVGFNVWAAGSPPASEGESRLLFWELVLPDEVEQQKARNNLLKVGYSQTVTPYGYPSFTDPWGITVALARGL